MTSHTTSELRKRLSELEKAVESQSSDAAQILIELKIALTTLPALQPDAVLTEALLPEIALARDLSELAALHSVQNADDASFERHVSQARTYYVDYATSLPASPRQSLILALNLLRLMAHNLIAELHTELELIEPPMRSDPCVAYALRLEAYLMEGSYSKLRAETKTDRMPHPACAHFVEGLLDTVREEVAACCQRAYTELKVSVARKLLDLPSDEEVMQFAQEREWVVKGDVITFDNSGDDVRSMDQVPSELLIKRSLEYARELEQII